MKKLLTSFLLLLSVLTLSAQSLVVKVKLTDGTVKEFAVSEVQEIAFDQEPYVDLGLNSGIKWASMNVDTTSVDGPGTPLKWDEAENAMKTKWALYENREWRLPTKEEFQELIDNCDWSEYKDESGQVIGYKVAKKGQENVFIILPIASYWSNSTYADDMAWGLRVNDSGHELKRVEMTDKLLIRPVWGKPLVTAEISAGAAQADFTTATIPVTVTSDGEIEIGSYGIRYATKADMSDAKTVKGTADIVVNKALNITLTGLEEGTTYYYQAFADLTTPAMNLETVVASFITRAKELALEVSVSDKTTTTATLDLAFTGNVASTVYYDVVYSTDKNLPEDAESTKKVQGNYTLSKADEQQHAEVVFEGLEPGNTYYYRVTAYYADSSKKTVTGNFETVSQALSVAELASSNVTFDEATITFTLTSNVLSEVSYTIEYGTDAALTNPSKKDGKTTLTTTDGQKVTDKLGGLKEGTKYYYRVVAHSGDKEAASDIKSFETIARSLKVTAYVQAYSATTATATLTFVGNVTGDISYELHYGEGSNLDQQIEGNFKMAQTSYATTIDEELRGLQAGKNYSFQLVARYNGADDVSDQGTFETPAKTLKLSAVDAVSITAKTASIQMTLLGNATEYVYYEINYSKNSDMSDSKKKEGNVLLNSLTGQTFAVGIDQLEELSKYYFTVSVKYVDTDADSKSGEFSTPEKISFVAPDKVDLGCSVLWGTFNLGAKDETGRGGFFGWGDPTGENISQYQAYGDRYVTPPADLTKEHQELDIVHVTLEDKWHTPTAAQMLELLTKCTWEHVSNYQGVAGLDGYIVRGKEQYANNHIFIPHSGYRSGVDGNGNAVYSTNTNECYYWSSQLSASPWGYGIFVKLQPGTTGSAKEQTFLGMHLRPVYGDGTSTPEEPEEPVVEEDHSMDVAKTVKDAFGNDMIVPADGVDLGLSVKWATWNVGATQTGIDGKGKEGQYGNYYSWGSTEPQSSYLSSDYTLNITERTLSAEHDAAQTKWGDGWRMPTEDECEELILNCNVSWTSVDGVSGYRYTSRINGKSIFMPAAGVRTSIVQNPGEYGYYWTSTKHPSNPEQATCMVFNNTGQYNDSSQQYERFGGLQIRPVKAK